MKRLAPTLLALTAFAATAQAEVPVYRNQELTLPGALVVNANGANYYGDVRFAANEDGTFTLVDAHRRNLAMVNDVTLVIEESFPVQVSAEVSGDLSVACVDLEEPGVIRDGNTFTVVLAETPLDPLILCAQALAGYEISIPLDVRGLQAGQYIVDVNGVETILVLDADNF
jgi:hypothetical protein